MTQRSPAHLSTAHQNSLKVVLEQTVDVRAQIKSFVVAGCRLHVVATAEWLELCTAALLHLPSFVGEPDLTLHVRSSVPETLVFDPSTQFHFEDHATGNVQLLEPSTGTALLQFPGPVGTPARVTPFLGFLSVILEVQNTTMIHAGAVATSHGAALLIGKGGSGKSTTSLLCLNAGMQFLSDDYCAIRLEPLPTVYSLYASAKFHFENMHRIPFVKVQHTADSDKGHTLLYPQFSSQLLDQAPIRVVLHPTQGSRLGLEAMHPRAALMALAPNSLFQLQPNKAAFATMAALLRSVPSYRLHLGDDPKAIPGVIQGLLEGL